MSNPVNSRDHLPAGLSQPARRALVAAGYLRVEQLNGLHQADLMKLHGLGPKAMDLLRRELASRGMSFAGGA